VKYLAVPMNATTTVTMPRQYASIAAMYAN
jgi:hypothetical protein